MAYKWKPSKSAKKEFAIKMQNDTEFANAYNERKFKKAEKRRAGSDFDYNSAGGEYVPTAIQHEYAMMFVSSKDLTKDQEFACNVVISGFSCNDKVHHDYIHVVNDMIRKYNIEQ